MPRTSTLTCVLLSAVAPLSVTAHYHHNHHQPGNWGHGGYGGYGAYHHNEGSDQSHSASLAAAEASPAPPSTTAPPAHTYGDIDHGPYPTGNVSTSGGSISTSFITRFTSTTTLTVTAGGGGDETASDENSPISATSAPDSLGISAALVAEGVSSVSPAQTSLADKAGAEAASSAGGEATCPAPVTVTVTNSETVTVTVPATTSEVPVESQAPEQVPSTAETQSASSSQTQGQSLPSSLLKPHYPSPVDSALAGGTALTEGTAPIGGSATGGPISASSSAPPHSARDVASSVAVSPIEASSTPSKTGNSKSLTPNGVKAGIAAYPGATSKAAWKQFEPYIGWYSDYTPTTPDCAGGKVKGIPMLWGDGHTGGDDTTRLADFQGLKTTPEYMQGFYEADCTPPMSCDISSPSTLASDWTKYLAPLGKKGTILGSPSMCKQKDETMLTPFLTALGKSPSDVPWQFTSIHTNKNTVEGVKADVEYYAKYGKPIWVSEFACVDDTNGFTPCTDPSEIATFIRDVVKYLQCEEKVVAYGYSLGEGLGKVWPMMDDVSGAISDSGRVYLESIRNLEGC